MLLVIVVVLIWRVQRMWGVGHAHWRIRMGRRSIFPQTMSTIFPRTRSSRLMVMHTGALEQDGGIYFL